ncbi:MAG: ABC transporter ATP-binding protein [Bacillota bacterium]|nr:ABC transporter ATP-binding protein [Bacillota bacterium]
MIEYRNISIEFDGKNILKDFNLAIAKGSKVLFYGKSGLGKSVLFKLILGFLLPKNGEIFIEGEPLTSKSAWELRKRIAYVSQEVDLGSGKVEAAVKNIFAYKANSHLCYDREELVSLMKQFDLPAELIAKEITSLSGGERQRLAIIMAILLQRKVFLLDEATAALDSRLKEKVIDFFMANSTWTVLVISHDKEWLEDKRIEVLNLEEMI